ncbi:MAG: hypothetical protein ACREYF_10265 [Gammaproteobacteria bacterium]
MIELAALVCELVKDALHGLALCTKSHAALTAENLFIRKQLAYYQERKISPRRFNNASRYLMGLLSGWFDWKEALVVVTPKTLIGWHRAGVRLFWRWKCQRTER